MAEMYPRPPDAAPQPGRPIVIAPDRRQAFTTAGVLVLLLGISIWLLFVGSLLTRLVAAAMLVFCATALRVGGRRIWIRRPLLVIEDEGLHHPTAGLISWDEITQLTVSEVGGARVLRIGVADDVAERLARPPTLLRPFVWAERAAAAVGVIDGSPYFSVPETLMPMTCEALRARIELRAGREWPP